MNRLKELRQSCGLSLRKLQEYTGIDFSRLAVIEKTDANLETKTVSKLTDFFKVSETYLFGKDGFVFYFDESKGEYFSLPYEQYKHELTGDVVKIRIVDGCVQRTLSSEGFSRLAKVDDMAKRSLDVRLNTERYLQMLDTLEPNEFQNQKERILEFFEMKEAEEALTK